MSSMANQYADGSPPAVLGEVDAVDGVPVGRSMTRKQLRAVRQALEEFQQIVGATQHCIVLAGGLGFRDTEKKKSTEEDVLDCCYRHFGYPETPQDATINVILDSGGGSLDSAFATVLFLRRFARNIRVYVPRRAKSAATLIALGADEVVMSVFAELGPLDTQIKDPRNPTKNVSALDCYQSVDYVQKFGLETLPKTLGVLLKETDARIPLAELVTTATGFALDEVTPMLGQVNTVDFGGWGRTLKIGEMYARALQRRLGHENYEKKAEEIAQRLVYGYTHHPYRIDYEEAREIGFNVSAMTEMAYATTLKIAEECGGSRCVGFVEDIRYMEEFLRPMGMSSDAPPSPDGQAESVQIRGPEPALAYDFESVQPPSPAEASSYDVPSVPLPPPRQE